MERAAARRNDGNALLVILFADLADLANAGMITVAAAIEKAQDVESLKQLIHRGDSATDAAAQAMAATGIDFKDAYSRKIGE